MMPQIAIVSSAAELTASPEDVGSSRHVRDGLPQNVLGSKLRYRHLLLATLAAFAFVFPHAVRDADTTSPTIILQGVNPATVYLGTAYTDAGATEGKWIRVRLQSSLQRATFRRFTPSPQST